MKNAIICAALLLAALLVSACSRDKKERQAEGTPKIEVAVPQTDSVTLHKTYPGYLTANKKVDVVGRVDGQLLTKTYQDGAFVKQGQVLFTIESTRYKDAVQQASAQLATARSNYEYASNHYAAMKHALESDAVSAISVAQAEDDMKTAQASIRNAEAALQQAQVQLGYCTVKAPISGFITGSTISDGNYINGEGAAQTLATIYDVSTLTVNFQIEDGQYLAMIGNGDKKDRPIYRNIPLNFEQPLPHKYTADLQYSSPSVDTSTGTLLLQAKIQNPYNELKDGMYVTVNLPYGTDPHAILIRDASISTDQLGKFVYVVNDSNKVVYTPIEVGQLYQDTLRLVTKGLTPKSRYVTKALMSVQNGETVEPVMATAPQSAKK